MQGHMKVKFDPFNFMNYFFMMQYSYSVAGTVIAVCSVRRLDMLQSWLFLCWDIMRSWTEA